MKDCEAYAALLDLYVDGELAPSDMILVREHLDTCPGCRAYVDDALAIRAAFPDPEDTPVPADFSGKVLKTIRTRHIRQAVTRPTHWGKAAMSLVACCALVLFLEVTPILQQGGKDVFSRTAAESEAPGETPPPYALAESPAQEARDMESGEKNVKVPLVLTPEEAGDLLAAYTPEWETDHEFFYELSFREYLDLAAALPHHPIPPIAANTPDDTTFPVLVEK